MTATIIIAVIGSAAIIAQIVKMRRDFARDDARVAAWYKARCCKNRAGCYCAGDSHACR